VSAAAVETRALEPTLALVRRAQKGDTEAFGTLFHSHRSRVYSLCLRMTRNIAEAEDLTQEAFLQVFRKLPTFRGDSALSTWMYRVAVNTVLMYFRKRGRPQCSIDEEPGNNDNGKSKKRDYGATDFQLCGCVDRIALARAIKELPHGYRKIFLLHEVEGYEHREIARLLRCSVGNSKSQLHKARLRMRELLTSGVVRDNRQHAVKSNGHTVKAIKAVKEARVLSWPSQRRSNGEHRTDIPLRVVREWQLESAA
jgi:RNA polymerase sigma-70 factor (ECF subfamily)